MSVSFFESHFQTTMYPEAHVTEAIILAVNHISIALRTGQIFCIFVPVRNALYGQQYVHFGI